MRKSFLAVFAAVAFSLMPLGLLARDLPAGVDAKPQIVALFDQWNNSLATGNPEAVAENYAPDAILIPTVSNKVRHDRHEIADYFEHFLQLKPKGSLVESNVRIFGDLAINSGTYDFKIVKDGKESVVKARFTFVYKKGSDGKWLIVEHHSSAMPEAAK
jgi:uncharacterized protein (TIGR02246 family)